MTAGGAHPAGAHAASSTARALSHGTVLSAHTVALPPAASRLRADTPRATPRIARATNMHHMHDLDARVRGRQ